MSKLIVSLPWHSQHSDTAASASSTPAAHLRDGGELAYALANDALVLTSSGSAPLNLLPGADKTILIVPAQALSWHRVDLPKAPKARLRAVLDGLLEEHVLDDTSAMSFALSPDASSGKAALKTWVAACDKAWLKHAIASFETAGCRVTQVVPEFWPQAERSNHLAKDAAADTQLYMTGSADDAWLSRVSTEGVLTVPVASKHTSSLHQFLTDFPTDAAVVAEPAVAALTEQALARPVILRQQAAAMLQSATSTWELAQFDLALSGDGEGIKRLRRAWQTFWQSATWRPVRWGLAGLLLANLIGLNAWAWQQQRGLDAKKKQLATLLTQTFPQVKVVVEPQLQMSKELALLRQSTGAVSAQNIESILSIVSPLFTPNSTPTNTPVAGVNSSYTAIEFIADKAVFKGLTLSGEALTLAQTKLKSAGYNISTDKTSVTVTPQAGR